MTITVTSIATNTVQVTASGTNTLANTASAISDAITGVNPVANTGWVLVDSTYMNSSNVATPTLTQVFKSINVDAVTYKYYILRWYPTTNTINTSCCESWNATTHAASNECYTYNNCSPIPFNTTSCDLIVMVHPRWANILSYSNGEAGQWAGVFEMQREDPTDTGAAGHPCFGWIGSSLLNVGANMSSYTNFGTTNNGILICLPRTKTNATGASAACAFAGDYGVAQVPNFLYASASTMPYYLSTAQNKFANNNWDTTRKLILPIKPIYNYQGTVLNYGQIYGLKMMPPTGGSMNKVKCTVDSNGNASNSGTLSDHWLMNNLAKYHGNYKNCLFENSGWTNTTLTFPGNYRPDVMVSTGAAYYFGGAGSSSYMSKVNALTNGVTALTMASGANIYDMKYDGERYVYYGTNSGLCRLDTVDDTQISLAIGAVRTLSISTTTIMCGMYTTSTTPYINRVLKSTFALESGTVGNFTSGANTANSFLESTASFTDSVTDYNGNVYMVSPVSAAQNFKITKITPDGIISYLNTSLTNYPAWQVGLTILDKDTLLVNQLASNTAFYQSQIQLSNFTTVDVQGVGISGPNVTALSYYRSSTYVVSGVIFTTFKPNAAQLITVANPLGYAGSTALYSSRTAWNDLTTAVMGSISAYPAIWFDGVRLFNNTDTGVRIWTKVNGESAATNIQLGQMALVA